MIGRWGVGSGVSDGSSSAPGKAAGSPPRPAMIERRVLDGIWVIGIAILLAGCGSGSTVVSDPLSDVRNERLGRTQRIKAIHEAWAMAESGTADRISVREDLKTVAWSGNWPLEMRLAALHDLASDTSEKGRADTATMFELMLPREPDASVTKFLSEHVAAAGRAEATPALVRSLSRPWPGTPDSARPEYAAISALNPGKSVQEVVYDVFLHPPQEGGAFGLLPAERVRADAWDLLARVDADGSARARLLGSDDPNPIAPVVDMRASEQELRCLPLSGDELRWLSSLHDQRDPVKRAWWDQTASAVAKVDAKLAPRLQLRHLEPIRWTSVHHPGWLTASRQELLSELAQRLERRETHRRRIRENQNWRPSPEKLSDWASKLSWADVLAILVIDDAIHERALVNALFAQAGMDYEDRSAEYGGVIRAYSGGTGAEAVLYAPRPGSRRGDHEFVASSDMINQSDDALAHYHFHVQEPRNSEYAGPSANDLAYAARYGRSCLVLTSVASGVMDVDFYQPDGAVIDLGEIRRD